MVQVSGRTRAKPGFVDTEFLLTFHYENLKTRTKVFWYKELPHTHHPVWRAITFYLSYFFYFLLPHISTLFPGVSVLFFKLLSKPQMSCHFINNYTSVLNFEAVNI